MSFNSIQNHAAPVLTKSPSLLARVSMEQGLVDEVWARPDTFYQRLRYLETPDPRRTHQKITYKILSPLKEAQKQINKEARHAITYPSYIMAGKKGSNYVDNCRVHLNPQTFISLDMESFFESVNQGIVFSIWRDLFKESFEQAKILTRLTTFRGALPRGAPSSPILANLSFWDIEPEVVSQLKHVGFTYTRYVDDIALSSPDKMTQAGVDHAVGIVLAMFHKKGVRRNVGKTNVKRSPQDILLHNVYIHGDTLKIPKKERRKIRAQVHQTVLKIESGDKSLSLEKELKGVKARLRWLAGFHPRLAHVLRQELDNAIIQSRRSARLG